MAFLSTGNCYVISGHMACSTPILCETFLWKCICFFSDGYNLFFCSSLRGLGRPKGRERLPVTRTKGLCMWMKASRLASLTAACFAVILMTAGLVQAATIMGEIAPPLTAVDRPFDISTGTADWVYYGYNGQTTGMNTAAGNRAHFSKLHGKISGCWVRGYNVYLNFSGAKAPGTSFVFENGSSTAQSGVDGKKANKLSFTSTLIAPSETLTIFLTSYNCRSKISAALRADRASLVIAKYTDTVVLPCNTNSSNDGSGQGTGVLTLTIHGGHKGDLLTFTDKPDLADVATTASNNVGV